MGLFSRLFSKTNDLTALKKAIDQQRYADALHIAEELNGSDIDAAERVKVQQLAARAGDALAKINLDEGLFLLRDGQRERAAEHLQLAQQQAVSEELIHQASEALQQLDVPTTLPLQNAPASSSSCSSCSSCGPDNGEVPAPLAAEDHPDFDAQLELILVGYPEPLATRYQQKSSEFLQAFVLAHQGDDLEAMKQFGKLPANEQDDLFDFEVGSLMARLGEPERGCDALYSAFQKNPDFLLAAETLVSILVAMKHYAKAISFISEILAQDRELAFCHAQLASVYHVSNDAENALSHARLALEAGHNDSRILLMTAMLLEAKNELVEAESFYQRIPGGGCGGGMNLYLAEFLLRQKRELRKVLDTFNHACRQEPNNPRWQLRVAQTYLGLGWDKRGKELLNLVVRDPRLMEELRSEGQALLAG
ncbi:MAG: hypothetical protein C0620_07605 [Desulfuromonas sp.]|nr:MAG: hypothetical protein C0620_07605 [Desulfuromonas sp.]